MKIGIISGSHRSNSQSGKVARFIQARLMNADIDTWLLDLADAPLPFWDEGIWQGDAKWQAILDPLSAELTGCDGFVVISPEWHGMVPAGLKNFFLMWTKGELAHKAAMLVSVAAGTGGAYPIAELRMSSYKNNRICYTPEHVIIRNVESVMNDQESSSDADRAIQQRIDYALAVLLQYTEALNTVRDSDVIDLAQFGNGM